MSGQKPIVVVGSINTDLVSLASRIPVAGETALGTDFQVHPGGKGANQAVAVGRLGYPVRMIGRLGSDTFGTQLRMQLEAAGVDTTGVAITEGASGVAVIIVSKLGENIIVVTPGANAKLTPHDIEANIEVIRTAGIVLTQLEIPLDTVDCLASLCAREHIPLMLDPAPAIDLPPNIFKCIEWLTPNETEAAFYVRQSSSSERALNPSAVADVLLSTGSRGVLLKMGGAGVYIASRNGESASIAAFPVKAIDTTAAGDAFNGGFATALMLGKTHSESARFAAAVAAISVTRKGAQPSMPALTEVEEFLRHSLGNAKS